MQAFVMLTQALFKVVLHCHYVIFCGTCITILLIQVAVEIVYAYIVYNDNHQISMLFINASFVITKAKANLDMQSSLVRSCCRVGSITIYSYLKTHTFLRWTANLAWPLVNYLL